METMAEETPSPSSSSLPESSFVSQKLTVKLPKGKNPNFSEPWKNLSSHFSLFQSRKPFSTFFLKPDSQKKTKSSVHPSVQHSIPPVLHLTLLRTTLEGRREAMRQTVSKTVGDSREKVKKWILQSQIKFSRLSPSSSSPSSSHAFSRLMSSLQISFSALQFPHWSTELAHDMLRTLENLRSSSHLIRHQMPMLASVPSVLFSHKTGGAESEPSDFVPLFAGRESGPESGAESEPSDEPIPYAKRLFDLALTGEQVSSSLTGVGVYTVSNALNEFVLVSDLEGNKALGIFCFRQEDAEALLAQVKDRDPNLGRGARVVEVMLDKVYRLNAEGIAFRFLPDPLQIKHAIEERSKRGDTSKGFSGIPVFQSENLILKIKNRRCCPVFFSKEDLQNALTKAIIQQKRSNPSLRVNTELQVGSFEDVLKRMEGSEEDSGWADIVFIPPGMDARNHLDKSVATNAPSGNTIIASHSKSKKDDSTVIC